MKLIVFFYMLLISTVFRCSEATKTPSPDDIQAAPITAVDMPAQATVGEAVPLEISFTLHNGCGRLWKYDVNTIRQDVHFTVQAKYEGDACTEALRTIKETYTYTPTAAGTYTFRFWQGNDKPFISKSITVQ